MGYFLAAQDMSAKDAEAARSQLLAALSHELRTPLNGVLAVVDLLARRNLDPESRALVDIVRRSAQDLADLVGDRLDAARLGVASEAVAAPLASGGRLRALVAEDHPVNRTVMQLLLDQLGVDYVMVEDGRAALEAVAADRFDVILMDMRMPRMGGLEASRRIRESGVATPIVAVTADPLGEADPEVFRAGVDAVLAKPITQAALARAIGRVLEGAPQRLPLARGA